MTKCSHDYKEVNRHTYIKELTGRADALAGPFHTPVTMVVYVCTKCSDVMSKDFMGSYADKIIEPLASEGKGSV